TQQLARKQEKKAKIFGAPTEAQWKRRNTPLSVHLREASLNLYFGRGFAFSIEPCSESPSW
ncbi:hypothetical protein, partial [Brevibacillus sp. HB2.2]|uniref:hypothetical protein n=1 Tax=Brevibacillus sp. HB2.2 TaxID=2738846 RepID=UPI001C2C3162